MLELLGVTGNPWEIVGIAATLFVLISFLFGNEWKIRVVNLIGAIIFVIYGIAIGAFSVYLLNGALIIIHLVKLYQHFKKVKAS